MILASHDQLRADSASLIDRFSTDHMKKLKNYTSEEITTLKTRALELWREDNGHANDLGTALLALRDALRNRHGAFKKWWQTNKLSQSRVSYCMRLASGKVAAAKDRQPTIQQIVISRIKERLDSFLKSYARLANSQAQALDDTECKLSLLFLDIVEAAGQLRGWKKVDEDDEEFRRSLEHFRKSLGCLLNDSFRYLTFEDLERMQPDCAPASQYVPKQPVASATA